MDKIFVWNIFNITGISNTSSTRKTNNDNKTVLQLAKEYYDIVKDSNRQLLIDRENQR